MKNTPTEVHEEPAAASNAAAPDELLSLGAQAQAQQADEPPPPGTPEPEPELPTGEVLLMLYKPLAAIAAPNWKLQDSECKALADAHALVIDKYFPDGLGKMGPEITACIVTVAILGVRFNKPMQEPKPEKTKGHDDSVVSTQPAASGG